MDALVEVHDEAEMARAGDARRRPGGRQQPRPAHLHGRPGHHRAPARPLAPKDALLVTESGLFTAADAARLERCGAKAMLVGESLMRQAGRRGGDSPCSAESLLDSRKFRSVFNAPRCNLTLTRNT